MASRLPNDFARLRADLIQKLGFSAALRAAALNVLDQLEYGVWGDEQGVDTVAVAQPIDATLSPLFDRVLGAQGVNDILKAVDKLCEGWDQLRLTLPIP